MSIIFDHFNDCYCYNYSNPLSDDYFRAVDVGVVPWPLEMFHHSRKLPVALLLSIKHIPSAASSSSSACSYKHKGPVLKERMTPTRTDTSQSPLMTTVQQHIRWMAATVTENVSRARAADQYHAAILLRPSTLSWLTGDPQSHCFFRA